VDTFELSASVAIWRGRELLLMKRTGGVGAGGWFLPGGHVEPGERPVEAAVREVREESGIVLDPASLSLADVMSYEAHGAMAHNIVYNALCPDGAEAVVNGEHYVARWYTPEAAIARFYDAGRLRGLGLGEPEIALATEVARVLRACQRARGMAERAEPSEERPLFG
jgi:ADP-ribose pyrophosphatase YjhB (NUDIX family)